MTNPTPAPERGKEPGVITDALTNEQLDGLACVRCGRQANAMVPVEHGPRGQLFACSGECAPSALASKASELEATVPDELDARVKELESLVSGIIDALGKLYKAPAINDALASEDKDTPLRFRVPTIVLERIAKCTEEALEVAQRASSIAYDDEMLGATLSVLSKDPTLPVDTTTHDPDFERLTALEDATGHAALGQVMNWISERVRGTIGDGRPSLHDLREELGLL